jgi:glycerol-3-phosphate acyltransferase PlsY
LLDALLVFVASYLLGSVPIAFLIVRKSSDVDIRSAGSGNAGGFNAYVVTQSRMIGITVGVLDALKGFIPVVVAGLVFQGSFLKQAIALFGAIGGHNYSFWLGFKGGRGLSTAAGGMFLLGFSYTLIWCTIWVIGRLLKRDILVSNLAAIFAAPLLLWLLPWDLVRRLIVSPVDSWTFLFFTCMLSAVLCLSHLDVVREVWRGPANELPDTTSSHL